VRGI